MSSFLQGGTEGTPAAAKAFLPAAAKPPQAPHPAARPILPIMRKPSLVTDSIAEEDEGDADFLHGAVDRVVSSTSKRSLSPRPAHQVSDSFFSQGLP